MVLGESILSQRANLHRVELALMLSIQIITVSTGRRSDRGISGPYANCTRQLG
ncbi:MAG: hypothetical protein F6K42_20515 [Leptolyngbya sp. SIO1D8]|nr:hypothetical protein [Leptolyngbya sp. SIO1D8]